MTDPLADPEELRVHLNMRDINVERAAQLIAQASRAVRSHCRGRKFIRVVGDVVTLDGNGIRTVILPDYPVEDVSEVQLDGVVMDTDLYEWSRLGVLRRCNQAWPDEYRVIQVIYTHGETDGVMEDVRGVVLAMAGRAYTFRDEVPDSIGEEPLSEASGFAPDMPLLPSERKILDAHRDVLV